MANPPTSVVVPGPDGPEPWGAPHRGRYRIADFGERKGNISLGVKMAADAPYWVQIYARWSRWVEATQTFEAVGVDTLAVGPRSIGDTGGEFGYTSSIFFDMAAAEGATHWQPVIHWYSAAPTGVDDSGLPPGAKVRMDDFYIPDNGYPVNTRPYLDGDQPGAMWEGERAASTSVYGTPEVVVVEDQVTIEDEILIEDEDAPLDPLLNFSLDDDLTI